MTAGSPPRVLVVDDNAVIRMVLVGMLEHLGAQCDIATDGNQAVSAAANVVYTLVLMDIQMPHLSGAEATRAILAASPTGRAPRIIGVTGGVDPARRDACLAAGMSEVLHKPLRLEDLSRLLRHLGEGTTP